MKTIMFNDKYGLTEAVLSGRKTQTRRIIPKSFYTLNWDVRENTLFYENDFGDFIDIRDSAFARYKVGEVVAVAQSYASILDELEDPKNYCCMGHWESGAPKRAHYAGFLYYPGMTNKMFVSADEMIHQIRITNIRVERLQDISEHDILAEGIEKMEKGYYTIACMFNSPTFINARYAYAWLIEKVSGKGTWAKNPYVFAYEFELEK